MLAPELSVQVVQPQAAARLQELTSKELQVWQVSARAPQLDAVRPEAGRASRDLAQVRALPQVLARP